MIFLGKEFIGTITLDMKLGKNTIPMELEKRYLIRKDESSYIMKMVTLFMIRKKTV